MKKLLALSLIAVCAAASSAHALDRDAFAAKVRKYTTAPGGPIRTLCICKEAGSYYLKVGYLVSAPGPAGANFEGVGIGCAVARFYPSDGAAAAPTSCNTSFEVLTK